MSKIKLDQRKLHADPSSCPLTRTRLSREIDTQLFEIRTASKWLNTKEAALVFGRLGECVTDHGSPEPSRSSHLRTTAKV